MYHINTNWMKPSMIPPLAIATGDHYKKIMQAIRHKKK